MNGIKSNKDLLFCIVKMSRKHYKIITKEIMVKEEIIINNLEELRI